MGFKINQGKGFQITFDNGLTLSTQFGSGNYCDNQLGSTSDPLVAVQKHESYKSKTAEIAVMNGAGDWKTRETMILAGLDEPCDDVVGWVSVADWAKLVWVLAEEG